MPPAWARMKEAAAYGRARREIATLLFAPV
jgi:hypothetical protein